LLPIAESPEIPCSGTWDFDSIDASVLNSRGLPDRAGFWLTPFYIRVPYPTVFRDRAPEDLILAWCARAAAAAESKSILVPALTARLEVGGLEGK
jgi:hypothetical protein